MNKILLFAHLKDAIGEEDLKMDASGMTVAQLKEKLVSEHGLVGLESVMTAVNEEFATDQTLINDGDTVAFIPPVSGG